MSPGSDDSFRSNWTLAPKVARALTVTVFGTISVLACIRVSASNVSVEGKALSIGYTVVLLAAQILWMSRRATELPVKLRCAVLLAQACLVYVPILQFREAWIGQPGFLAGSALIALPSMFGWLAAALVVLSIGVIQGAMTGSTTDIAYVVLSTTLTGLVMYGLTWFVAVVTELQSAREELATMAVARERLRVARDLHDLLGYSLSAITLKTELIHRLMTRHPARARDELAEVLPICRQALTDVRAVARSYREMSLDKECETARRLLAAADVSVRLDLAYSDLPVRVATVLATVLREGVTNLLRHSKAQSCEITVHEAGAAVTFEMLNDGASPSRDDSPSEGYAGGSGLHNLSTRVAEVGGALTAARRTDNTFQLQATIPLTDHQENN